MFLKGEGNFFVDDVKDYIILSMGWSKMCKSHGICKVTDLRYSVLEPPTRAPDIVR